jgi:hypothetical protein
MIDTALKEFIFRRSGETSDTGANSSMLAVKHGEYYITSGLRCASQEDGRYTEANKAV